MTNTIKGAILINNHKFAEDWETTQSHINWWADEHQQLKGYVIELKGLSSLQQTALQSCQNQIAGLEETVEQLVAMVCKLESSVCCCCDWLLLPGLHFAEGEKVVVDLEEGDDEEEDSLKYETEVETSDPSYMTLPSTGGCTKPSPHPSCSPTPEDSNPETNVVLQMSLIEAHIEAFLAEADDTGDKDPYTQWAHGEYIVGTENT